VLSLDGTFERHAQDLRETWQARVLAGTKGRLNAIVLSVLAHNFDDGMPVLLRVVYPGFVSIQPPFYSSAARIMRSGQIAADVVDRDGRTTKNEEVFRSTRHMEGTFRRLADRLKLTDAERIELFAAVKRWVVADFRLDPAMDPRDPGARRLVH
jgi:hypothetical protein